MLTMTFKDTQTKTVKSKRMSTSCLSIPCTVVDKGIRLQNVVFIFFYFGLVDCLSEAR